MLSKRLIIIVTVLVSAVLIMMIGCSGVVTETDGIIEETVEPVAMTDIAGIETEPVGTEVSTGDITWKIKDIDDQGTTIVSTENLSYKAIRGKFIIIDFMIINSSEETRILYDLNVVDSKGRIFTVCLPAYAYMTDVDACAITDIAPGIEYMFNAPFDVSPDSEGLVLEITDLKNPPEEKAYIDLGI
jgi:hypothetical protein